MADPEKIGKYQILDRIGRGGMGTIFKAHDPVLGRPVALKVISTDVDVTDEIRARFFREAQACARLSHPNIVTVYDMGEDDGRLFIVMELLEGVELRRLIADRTPLALEDKLSIMEQVCNGLHYAHQRGIVHRDVKPANIILLTNDQVKLLDFGIAQIENLQGTLTRTGLIMGTLRYMAPEQLRGRADHRTDIFAVGAVFYEFLSLKPPYDSKDTLHLLDQLRTEDPIPLHTVDPTIPAQLSDIVARAMRKEPQERFADLRQMRQQIESMHRTLTEEAGRLEARILTQRDQLGQLQAELADRVGCADGEAPTIPDEPPRLAALQAQEVDLAGRIEAVRGMLSQAEALAPAFERASELLRTGQLGEAITEFEAIVAAMPGHIRAADGLARAREGAEAERRSQVADKLVHDARAAVDANELTRGLELLQQAAAVPPPAEALPEIVALRETAEKAAVARAAARKAREQAEDARAQLGQGRNEPQVAIHDAPDLWQEAQMKFTEAEAAFARSAYSEAVQAFDAATAAYRRVEEALGAAQRQRREAAARAREQAGLGRQRAEGAEAPRYARELWDAAEAILAAAQAALASGASEGVAGIFNDALGAYGRAEQAALEARRRERQQAEAAGERAGEASRPVPRRRGELGDTADAKISVADEDELTRLDLAGPARKPRPAVVEEVSGRQPQVTGRQPQGSGQPQASGRQEVGRRRIPWIPVVVTVAGLAAIVVGVSYWRSPRIPPGSGAPPVATAARPAASAPSSDAGVGAVQSPPKPLGAEPPATAPSQAPAPSSGGVARVGESDAPPKNSAERPVKPPPGNVQERGGTALPAEGARGTVQAQARLASARQAAERAAASFYAPKLLASAQAKEREGAEALRRSDYDSAVQLLGEAQSIYQAASEEARRTADKERQIAPLKASVERARGAAIARRQDALAVEAGRLAEDLFRGAEAKHAEGDALVTQENFPAAARAYDDAAAGYAQAALNAKAGHGSK